MLCKAIYNTRADTEGNVLARVEIVTDYTPAELPTTGEGIEGLADGIRIDMGSRLSALDSGEAYVYGAGEWHKLADTAASGVIEISEPGTYDVSDKALAVVR